MPCQPAPGPSAPSAPRPAPAPGKARQSPARGDREAAGSEIIPLIDAATRCGRGRSAGPALAPALKRTPAASEHGRPRPAPPPPVAQRSHNHLVTHCADGVFVRRVSRPQDARGTTGQHGGRRSGVRTRAGPPTPKTCSGLGWQPLEACQPAPPRAPEHPPSQAVSGATGVPRLSNAQRPGQVRGGLPTIQAASAVGCPVLLLPPHLPFSQGATGGYGRGVGPFFIGRSALFARLGLGPRSAASELGHHQAAGPGG